MQVQSEAAGPAADSNVPTDADQCQVLAHYDRHMMGTMAGLDGCNHHDHNKLELTRNSCDSNPKDFPVWSLHDDEAEAAAMTRMTDEGDEAAATVADEYDRIDRHDQGSGRGR